MPDATSYTKPFKRPYSESTANYAQAVWSERIRRRNRSLSDKALRSLHRSTKDDDSLSIINEEIEFREKSPKFKDLFTPRRSVTKKRG